DGTGFPRWPDISQRGRFSFSRHARRRTSHSTPSRFRGSEPPFLCAPKKWRRMAAWRRLCPRAGAAARDRNRRANILWRTLFGAADAAFTRAQGRPRVRGISMATRQALGNARDDGDGRTERSGAGIARGIHHGALLGLHRAPLRLQRVSRRASTLAIVDRAD